jgi:hypothetical protein
MKKSVILWLAASPLLLMSCGSSNEHVFKVVECRAREVLKRVETQVLAGSRVDVTVALSSQDANSGEVVYLFEGSNRVATVQEDSTDLEFDGLIATVLPAPDAHAQVAQTDVTPTAILSRLSEYSPKGLMPVRCDSIQAIESGRITTLAGWPTDAGASVWVTKMRINFSPQTIMPSTAGLTLCYRGSKVRNFPPCPDQL